MADDRPDLPQPAADPTPPPTVTAPVQTPAPSPGPAPATTPASGPAVVESPVTADQAKRVDRLKAKADSVKARALDTRDRLEAQRPHNTLIDVLFGGIERDTATGGALLAGALAFRFFLFLIPYVFVTVIGLGVGADVAGADPRDIARQSGITGLAATAINSAASASTWSRVVALAIALYALLSGARNLVKALRISHALVWGVPLVRLRKPTRAALGLIVVLAATGLMVRGIHLMRARSFIGWVIALVLFTTLPALLWLWCSLRFLPAAPGVTWHDLWPGALLMGVGLEALHIATVVWIAGSMASKSETYGAIGAALTILLWAYLLGRLVTMSAALNSHMWYRRRAVAEPDAPPWVANS